MANLTIVLNTVKEIDDYIQYFALYVINPARYVKINWCNIPLELYTDCESNTACYM